MADQKQEQTQQQSRNMPPMNPVQSRNNFDEFMGEKIDACFKNGPPTKVDEQEFALIVVLGPEGCRQRNVKWIFQLLGVFPTEDAAKEHSRELYEAGYKWFDIHIAPMYKMLPFPPCVKKEQVEYVDREMKEIMGGYRDQEKHAQRVVRDRVSFSQEEEMRATKRLLESVGQTEEAKQLGKRIEQEAASVPPVPRLPTDLPAIIEEKKE